MDEKMDEKPVKNASKLYQWLAGQGYINFNADEREDVSVDELPRILRKCGVESIYISDLTTNFGLTEDYDPRCCHDIRKSYTGEEGISVVFVGNSYQRRSVTLELCLETAESPHGE